MLPSQCIALLKMKTYLSPGFYYTKSLSEGVFLDMRKESCVILWDKKVTLQVCLPATTAMNSSFSSSPDFTNFGAKSLITRKDIYILCTETSLQILTLLTTLCFASNSDPLDPHQLFSPDWDLIWAAEYIESFSMVVSRFRFSIIGVSLRPRASPSFNFNSANLFEPFGAVQLLLTIT